MVEMDQAIATAVAKQSASASYGLVPRFQVSFGKNPPFTAERGVGWKTKKTWSQQKNF
jgi:hypothetical protein